MKAKLVIIALIFTAHYFACEGKDSVEQTTREMTANEGHKVTLQCNFSTSATNAYLFWYKQLPNTSPTFILSEFTFGKGTTEPEYQKRFSATINSTSNSVPLIIQDVCVSDSAVYYCALKPNTNTDKIIFGRGTKLILQSEEVKPPSIYKVNDSCLATDFTRHNALDGEPAFTGQNISVRYEGEKTYSAFAWGAEMDCKETGGCKEGSSAHYSQVESDEKMNFMSLGIFWLRILFLKTVVFNVLMTVKAWMS